MGFICLSVIVFYQQSKAQKFVDQQQKIVSIAEAKRDKDNNFIPDKKGEQITISGRVAVASGILSIDQLQITIQDKTGGILIFNPEYQGPKIHAGDSLIVTGTLNVYFGLTELENPHIIFADTLNREQPTPVEYDFSDAEKFEGQLVTLTGRIINKGTQSTGDFLVVAPVEGSDNSIRIYNSKYHRFSGLLQKFSVGEIVHISGILIQHDNENNPNRFYEIIPTSPKDIKIIRHNIEFYLWFILIILGITLLIFLHNIYLQRKVNRRTKHLNDSLKTNERFLSIISHDIRSPLSGVLGLSKIMEEETTELPDKTLNEYSAAIHNSVNSTLQLLNNLLEWSKMRTGKTVLAISEFDLNELINSTLSYYTELASQKKVLLKNLLNQPFFIEADRNMIDTILRNLISNALKFTDAGGKITVNAQRTENNVAIEVSDTGHGISPEKQELLFSQKKYEEGQGGLGLLLCKEMVNIHSGSINVSSTINKGTTFSISLPQKHLFK